MRWPHVSIRNRVVEIWVIAVLGVLVNSASADLIATLSLEPNAGVTASPGEIGAFDVFLRDYRANNPADPVVAIGLNIAASDDGLTGSGTDFNRFAFSLDSGLSGIFGGVVFDGSISDDGRVQYGANLAPFGSETGILMSMGDVKLGTLFVEAPSTSGTFTIDLFVDSTSPIAGGTFLLVDDGTFPGPTLPGDGLLTVLSSQLTVVPEPSTMVLCIAAIGCGGGIIFQRRRSRSKKPAR
jgi:hypothetical protein